jgi:hypothetical protein
MKLSTILKFILAILLFICLLDMPYGYFQFIRLASLVVFTILAYQSFENNKQMELIIYVGLALLFQPFFKISLGRELWNIVDVIVGIGLVISSFTESKENSRK